MNRQTNQVRIGGYSEQPPDDQGELAAALPRSAAVECWRRNGGGYNSAPRSDAGNNREAIETGAGSGAVASDSVHLPGMRPVSAGDLLDPRKARRRCGETGATLRLLDEYSRFFSELLPAESDFVTFTWRELPPAPEHIGKRRGRSRIRGYRTPKKAFRAVHGMLRDCHVRTPSLLAAERCPGAECVHVHGLVRHLTGADRNAVFVTAVRQFGSTRILPAHPAAFPYVCKYLFKHDSCGRHDWLDLSGLHARAGAV